MNFNSLNPPGGNFVDYGAIEDNDDIVEPETITSCTFLTFSGLKNMEHFCILNASDRGNMTVFHITSD
jgi:hypothetical protein